MVTEKRTLVKQDFHFAKQETGEFNQLFWSLKHSDTQIIRFVNRLRTRMADLPSVHSSCVLKLSVELERDKAVATAESYGWYVGSVFTLGIEVGIGTKPVAELVALEELAQPELLQILDTMMYRDLGLVEDHFAVGYNRLLGGARRLVELSQEAGLVSSFGFTNDRLVIELNYPALTDFGAKLVIASFRDPKKL